MALTKLISPGDLNIDIAFAIPNVLESHYGMEDPSTFLSVDKKLVRLLPAVL